MSTGEFCVGRLVPEKPWSEQPDRDPKGIMEMGQIECGGNV